MGHPEHHADKTELFGGGCTERLGVVVGRYRGFVDHLADGAGNRVSRVCRF